VEPLRSANQAAPYVPRIWRSALHRLAFMVRTSGGDPGVMDACRQAEQLLAAPYRPTGDAAPVLAPLSELKAIGELLRTQDNRSTDQPMFIVQQIRSYVTNATDYHDSRIEWRESISGDYALADAAESAALEEEYQHTHTVPGGWDRLAVIDVWEFVTACFTEQGCKDFILINGHNLNSPRIYADGSYRNNEFRAIRNALIALPSPGFPAAIRNGMQLGAPSQNEPDALL
jgi:hypothetical protein